MDKTKAKIEELCPDVMELKHGCYFEWNYDVWFINCERCEDGMIFAYSCTGDKHSWPAEMGAGPHWQYKNKHFKREEFVTEPEYFKILGSPITLAVVLRAIHKMQPANKTLVNLECDGQFIEYWFNFSSKQSRLGPTWNLEHDNYDQQSEECKQFLGSLLGV